MGRTLAFFELGFTFGAFVGPSQKKQINQFTRVRLPKMELANSFGITINHRARHDLGFFGGPGKNLGSVVLGRTLAF